ncbi:acyl carrier protein [Actinokineospora enzanensis]|uniref:acyl carrier protein n=1 Tax=Actinokineospora enzanensis TaxID=155975 RepID=UPI0003694F0B|nr:acyl carrier protein [Actinokineospora enzanensis]
MGAFTITELVDTLRESAGEDEDITLDGDILTVTFEDLGYDSLALLNTVSRIERELGVRLPDGAITEANTPAELLDAVNNTLAETV